MTNKLRTTYNHNVGSQSANMRLTQLCWEMLEGRACASMYYRNNGQNNYHSESYKNSGTDALSVYVYSSYGPNGIILLTGWCQWLPPTRLWYWDLHEQFQRSAQFLWGILPGPCVCLDDDKLLVTLMSHGLRVEVPTDNVIYPMPVSMDAGMHSVDGVFCLDWVRWWIYFHSQIEVTLTAGVWITLPLQHLFREGAIR